MVGHMKGKGLRLFNLCLISLAYLKNGCMFDSVGMLCLIVVLVLHPHVFSTKSNRLRIL